jgi:hypothetical protein
MQKKVVSALVMGAWAASLISGCGGKERNFGQANAGGAANAGASGGGARGGSEAEGGRRAFAGMAGVDDGSGAASGEAGAGGEAGASCQGSECASCADAKRNACGGCAELVAAPDTACGDCGTYECAANKESVTCHDPGKNACGGCGVLASAPNSSCGACGDWQCTTDKTSVKCSGTNANACGGCGTLANAPGVACGQCGKYECSADKASTVCKDPGLNACGGCTAIPGTLGASCGACSVTACASDKNSLVCNSQCTGAQVCVSGLNQCKTADCSAADSCGKSDGAGSTCTNTKGNCPAKPNSTGQCSGASCAYTCKTKTLSCSTAAEPACGSWNFESKTAEGWYLDTVTWGANDAADKTKGLYLAAPPGSGAGSYSLAVDVDGTTGKSGTTILITLCPGSAAATGITGKFHASVWWKPSDNKGGLGGPGYAYTLPQGGGVDTNCPAGAWFDVPTQAVAGANITQVGVSIGGIDGHKGTLYFDNFYFE